MLAVQGPNARELAAPVIGEQWRKAALALKPFTSMHAGHRFVARTGYTGEDGWEIVMPEADVANAWRHLLEAGHRALRPRRARHVATRSRDEPVRQ